MNVFAKRPFASCCAVFISATAISLFLSYAAKCAAILIAAFFGVLAIVAAVILRAKGFSKYKAVRCVSVLLLICASAAIISFLCFDVRHGSVGKYYGEEKQVDLFVNDRIYSGDSSTEYDVTVTDINGQHVSLRAKLCCNYVSDIQPGDSIRAEVIISDFDSFSAGYSERRDMISDGYMIKLTSESDDSIERYEIGSKTGFFKSVNFYLSRKLVNILGKDSGALAGAVLLGNRDGLSGEVRLDFTRAGVSHLLALSGMHVTIILGAVALLLRKLMLPRKLRAVMMSLFAIFYLLLTGCSPSALRAVIMVSTVYLSWLLFAPADSVTSVSFAGALILLLFPESVLSYGFWLSLLAAFGIIIFSPEASRLTYRLTKRGRGGKILKSLFDALSVGLIATASVMLLTCIWFGSISVMSVPSTILLSIPFTLLLVFGLLIIIFLPIPPVCEFLAYPEKFISELILDYVSGVSDIEGVLLPSGNILVYAVAALGTLSMLYFIIFKAKRPKLALVSPIAAFGAVILAAYLGTILFDRGTAVNYVVTSGTSEQIVISRRGESVICDISSGSNYITNVSAYAAKCRGSTEINALILTDFNAKQPAALAHLCATVKLRSLYIPKPSDGTEYYLAGSLMRKAGEHGVTVFIYDFGDILTLFGESELKITSESISRSVYPVRTVDYSGADGSFIWLTPVVAESSSELIPETSGYDAVIFGCHAPSVKSPYYFDCSSARTVIFANRKLAGFADPDGLPFESGEILISSGRTEFYLSPENKKSAENEMPD